LKYTKLLFFCCLAGLLSTVPAGATVIMATSTASFTSGTGVAYPWDDAIDTGMNMFLTDYAAAAFNNVDHPYGLVNLDFDRGAGATAIDGILYTDRTTVGATNGTFGGLLNVFATQIEYIFSNNADFSSPVYTIVVNRTTPVAPTSYLDFQTFTALTDISARYMRFEILAVNGTGTHAGAADFEFVPEPTTNLLIGTGILIGLVLVRRRAFQS